MIGHKLWYRSWHQVPAGSLPNDDAELCHLAELGFDERSFRKAKAVAMRGWIECDDGRLYHPVVCEAALEAWQEKLRQRLASRSGNAKRWGLDFDPTSVRQEFRDLIACLERLSPSSKSIQKAQKSLSQCDGSSVPEGPFSDPTGINTTSHRDIENAEKTSLGTGTGTGIKEREEDFVLVVADAPTGPPSSSTKVRQRSYSPAFEAAWSAYPHHKGRSSKPNAQAEFDRLPPDEQAGLVAAIERFKPNVPDACGGKGAPDMAVWLKQAKHQNWTSGPAADHSPEVWQQLVDCWRSGDVWPDRLGPAPDKPDTRVPAHLRPTNDHKLDEAA
jgi:hypothetical protein